LPSSFLNWSVPTAGDHPRVWIESVSALVTRKNTTHASYWADLKTFVDARLSTAQYPNSYYDNKDGEYTGALAFYYRLDPTKTSHAARARDIALYLASKTMPGGSTRRDYLVAMTLVYDWTYDFLTTSQRATLRSRINDYVESMYLFRDGEALWGTSHGDMVHAAFALCAIMADGTSTENTRWVSRMDSMMDEFDDGAGNGFWVGFRYFGNSENGTHKGSGGWSYINAQEWFYALLFPALKSAVGFDWRTDGGPESWWENCMHWQLWHVRRGANLTSTFWREHESRGLSYFSIYAHAHALQIADVNTGTLGQNCMWLADLAETTSNCVNGPWNIYPILWRNPARTSVEPTIASTGGKEMKVFPRSGKVVFRGAASSGNAWGEDSISAVWHCPRYFTEGHQQRRAGQVQIGGYGSRVFFEHGHYDSDTSLVPKQGSTGANTGHRWSYYGRSIAGNCLLVRHSSEKTASVIDSTRRQVSASSTFGVQSGSTVIYSETGDQLWPKNTALNDYQPNTIADVLAEPKWVGDGVIFSNEPVAGNHAYAVANHSKWYWSGKVTRYRQHCLWVKKGTIPSWTHGAVLVVWEDLQITQDATYGNKQVQMLLQSNLQAVGTAADLRVTSADGEAKGWHVVSGPAVQVEHVSGFKDLDGVTYPASSTDDKDDSNDGVWRAQINPTSAGSSFSIIRVYFIGPASETTHPAVVDINTATERGATIGGIDVKMKKGDSFQATVDAATGGTGTTSTSNSTTTLSTTTRSTTSVSTVATTTPPGITLPIPGEAPAVMPQRNPTNDKPASRLFLAGSSAESPCLAGLATSLRLVLGEDEQLHRWRVYSDSGFDQELTWEMAPDNEDEDAQQPIAITTIVFGVQTDTGPTSVRNFIEWQTSRGTTTRQVWVRDPPETGGIYCANQECQGGVATFPITPGDDVTFGINILPTTNDEFYSIGEYEGNRYANTLRMWGGAATVEVEINDTVVLGERDIADLDGFFWHAPGVGDHTILARLRAKRESIYFVELTGTLRVEAL
jgi:hypothetical protein